MNVRHQIEGLICRSRFCANRFQDRDGGVQIGRRECRGGQLLRCKQQAFGEVLNAVQHAPLHNEVSTFGQTELSTIELHARSTSKKRQASRVYNWEVDIMGASPRELSTRDFARRTIKYPFRLCIKYFFLVLTREQNRISRYEGYPGIFRRK